MQQTSNRAQSVTAANVRRKRSGRVHRKWLSRVLEAVLVLLAFSFLVAGYSQVAPGAPGQDPLVALMLSQPRIDVDSPVVPISGFEPAIVKAGQDAVYRVTFNALETSIKLPSKLHIQPSAEMRATAHGQLLVLSGTNYQPRTTFNYRVRPSTPGMVTVPQFTVNVYGKSVQVPAAQLRVVLEPPPGAPGAQLLRLQIPETNIYVGQAVRASVALPPATSLVLQHSSPLQINGQGLLIDPNTLRPRLEAPSVGNAGPGGPAIVYDLILTPIASGKTTAFGQAFVGSRIAQVFPQSPGIVAGLPQYTLVDSDPVELTILPLPNEGRLPGFTGAVGSFSSDLPQLATNVLRVGDPVKLTVKIRGEGNLARLVPPPAPRTEQWRVFQAEPNATHPQIIQAQGFTVFNYTLVPLSEGAKETPAIPFSCFDPSEGRFRNCTIQPVPVTVLPGASPAELAILQQADAAGGVAEEEPVLTGLAASPGLAAASLVPVQQQVWFPFVQAAPAAAFAALWLWDRRRRFFETHPDVLLRRRARRALRKQWRSVRRAAARNDGLEFSRSAVRALDIACSPFYPADPRALVGADILAILPESQRSGSQGQAIRELFDASDAARYSFQAQDASRLLELESEVEALLRSLDERLRV